MGTMGRAWLGAALCTLVAFAPPPASAQDATTSSEPSQDGEQAAGAPDQEATPEPATSTSSAASTGTLAEEQAATEARAGATAASTTSAAESEEDESRCRSQEVFDPSSPRLELSIGGGYAAYFVTWRQAANLDVPGRFADGLYHGPLVRAEVAFSLGAISLSALYTHVFSSHDGGGPGREWQFLSGELGLQCACQGSIYVWNFGLEIGWDLNNSTLLAGIEHRSLFYLWEGLFIGFDFDVGVLVGITSNGASGGGFEGSLFIGYSIG